MVEKSDGTIVDKNGCLIIVDDYDGQETVIQENLEFWKAHVGKAVEIEYGQFGDASFDLKRL